MINGNLILILIFVLFYFNKEFGQLVNNAFYNDRSDYYSLVYMRNDALIQGTQFLGNFEDKDTGAGHWSNQHIKHWVGGSFFSDIPTYLGKAISFLKGLVNAAPQVIDTLDRAKAIKENFGKTPMDTEVEVGHGMYRKRRR